MPGDDFRSAVDDLEKGAHAGAQVHAVGAPGDDPGVAHPSVTALRERFGEVVLGHQVMAGDEHVVFIAPERILDVLTFLRHDQQFDLLADVTAVDFGGGRPLQVVYVLWSIPRKRQLRVKAELPLDRLEIASAVPIWSTANWLEREVYDMFGITFDGHPDLRRILMPENYAEGHPLRKDFPLRGRFSRAEQTRRALAMEVEDFYIPSELDVMRKGGGAAAGPGAAVFTPGGTGGERSAPEPAPPERDAPAAGAREPGARGEGPASGEEG